MAKDRKKIVHIHSNIVDKQPTPTSLEYGELSVNYNSGKEFIATRNSDDKVVRFSSDEQIVTIMEKKDVIPYSGTVDNIHLDTNKSNIEIKLNQVVANNTVKHDVVNGAKDIDGNLVNPTTDGGLTNGAGFAIDMSPYALIGANPSFSSLTVDNNTAIGGNVTIVGETAISGDTHISNDIHVDGDTIIEGKTYVSGETHFKEEIHIDGPGFNKHLNWTYGDVKDAFSGSTNYASDVSFVIPKCVSDMHRAKLSWMAGRTTAGTYDPGDACNEEVSKSINIPSELSHLTDWGDNCLSIRNNLCVSGTVTATGGMYTPSDRELKDNISYIGGHDISKASRIQLKSFNYKDDASKRKVYGVIAQDLEEIGLNELVHYDENGMRSVDYTGLLLLKLAALEKEISILKHKLEEKNN